MQNIEVVKGNVPFDQILSEEEALMIPALHDTLEVVDCKKSLVQLASK